jgi:hypothetical protein
MTENFVHEPVPPYEIVIPKINEDHLWSMQQWCYEQFGVPWLDFGSDPEARSGSWTVFWGDRDGNRNYRWHFRTEQDAVLFMLRWS